MVDIEPVTLLEFGSDLSLLLFLNFQVDVMTNMYFYKVTQYAI